VFLFWNLAGTLDCSLEVCECHQEISITNWFIYNVYDNRVAPLLSYYNTYVTRSNKFKLQNHSSNHNFRKIFFSARIVNIWNSLPNYVVDVQSIDVFKVRLDKFWAQQEVMFVINSMIRI